MKAFADEKINVSEKLKLVLGSVENIVGNGENAGYHLFLLFLQCFQKAPFQDHLKSGLCGKELSHAMWTSVEFCSVEKN